VVKAYLFVFFHILYLFLPNGEFSLFLVYLGAISMLVAEVTGLRQSNLKRVFAYSSLGQIGLIFTAFALQNADAIQAALFIVLAHSIAKALIFLALAKIEKEHKSVEIQTLKELNAPFLRVVMLIAMLSLLGIPLFAGFVGKFLLFKNLAVGGLFGILAILVFASLLEAVYYFKLVGFMFSKGEKKPLIKIDFTQKFVLSLLAFVLFLVGVAPFLISGFFNESANLMLDVTLYINSLMGAH
jgi:multicomponent Na+:H+ antiporter subunit D